MLTFTEFHKKAKKGLCLNCLEYKQLYIIPVLNNTAYCLDCLEIAYKQYTKKYEYKKDNWNVN